MLAVCLSALLGSSILEAGNASQAGSPGDAIRPASIHAPDFLSRIRSARTQGYLSDSAGTAGPEALTSIKTDDFEGVFPNGWQVFDNDGATGGEVYWATNSYRPFGGSYSAWPAGGGADGVAPGSGYPNNMDSWMVYGPFDLSDAVSASLDFMVWMDTQTNVDLFSWMASSDGENFNGYRWSGSSGGWAFISFDLSEVSVIGQSEVYVAFIMQSDESVSEGGVFVDDVVLRKDVGEPDIEVWPLAITI